MVDGASVTSTARRYGISRATLHRWLQAFDPNHPIASIRPKKTGPKAPRWTAEALDRVAKLIADHPDWWGKRRVTASASTPFATKPIVLARPSSLGGTDEEA